MPAARAALTSASLSPTYSVSSGKTPLWRIQFDEEKHRLDALEQLLRQSLWEGEERERKTIAVFQEHAQAFLEAVQEMAGKLT